MFQGGGLTMLQNVQSRMRGSARNMRDSPTERGIARIGCTRLWLTRVRATMQEGQKGVSYQWPDLLQCGGVHVREYHEALRIDPDFSEAQCSLGIVYAVVGRIKEATASYQTFTKLARHSMSI